MHHPASAACPGCRLPGPRMRWEGPLTEPDNIVRLAEGLQRLYGEEASLLIRQFAAENAKVGDAVSASFWNSIALVMTNSKSFMTHSAGEQG